MNNISSTFNRRAPQVFLLIISVVFAGLVVAEWYFRFSRYHYEMQLFHLPTRPMSKIIKETSGFSTNQVKESRGGDLTAFIGMHGAAAAYEEVHPAGTVVRDRHGFVNQPYDESIAPDVVVVGDSFMTVGRVEETFASRLAAFSGLRVRNRALIGHGPFLSVEKFLDDEAYKESPPDYLIWGFAEREVSGAFFTRFSYGVESRSLVATSAVTQAITAGPSKRLIVHWRSFNPDQLQKSLPASSLLAESSQWIWNRARYLLFGKINPDLIPARDVLGGNMLFYRYHVEALNLTYEKHNPQAVTRAIRELDQLCRVRGIRLIVVLIPEKEQVFRDWLPADPRDQKTTMPASILWTIEEQLQQQGVLVANLLPSFNDATVNGRRLYWRDDTHWNPDGVKLAAEEVGRIIQSETIRQSAREPDAGINR